MFQFVSKVVVKQIALCSYVIKSPSVFGVQLFSSVWNNPEEYSFFFRLPFQSSSGFSRLYIVAIFSAINTYSPWGWLLLICWVILHLPNYHHQVLEE